MNNVPHNPSQEKESALDMAQRFARKGAALTKSIPSAHLPAVPVFALDPYVELIRRLMIPGSQLLVGGVDRIDLALTPDSYTAYVKANANCNLYFLGGIPPEVGLVRANDEQVRKKNYFVIDVDVRELRKKEGKEISDDEIKELGHWCYGTLATHPFLSEWSYIIFSGNGLHLWYIGDPTDIYSPEHWKHGMKFILEEFEKHTKLTPDWSCVNVSKLIRVPGSFNNKNGRHTKVEILCAQ